MISTPISREQVGHERSPGNTKKPSPRINICHIPKDCSDLREQLFCGTSLKRGLVMVWYLYITERRTLSKIIHSYLQLAVTMHRTILFHFFCCLNRTLCIQCSVQIVTATHTALPQFQLSIVLLLRVTKARVGQGECFLEAKQLYL